MRIAVSACLLGENCRYDGQNCYRSQLMELLKGHEVIPVCPETLGGLLAPRNPMEIQDGRMIDATGKDLTSLLEKGVDLAYQQVKESAVDLVILKSKSPTCGSGLVYDGTFTGRLIHGNGWFAQVLKENNFFILQVD